MFTVSKWCWLLLVVGLTYCTTPWTKVSAPPMEAAVSVAEKNTTSVPLDVVIKDPKSYLGQNLTLVGKVAPGNTGCTEKKCGSADKCCNNCSADVLFTNEVGGAGLILVGSYQKKPIMCTGNNCTLNCIPRRGYNYRINGTVEIKDGQAYFNVIWIQSVR